MSRVFTLLAVCFIVSGLAFGLLGKRDDITASGVVFRSNPALIERGEYLARAGNCMGCHTIPGGTPYAGGRGIETPFGTVFSSNLTPDNMLGIGNWSADDFWRAIHEGKSRNGRLLYPAFPYVNYTHVTRADSDAIFAWLRTLPMASHPNRPHALRFPYDRQSALAAWRTIYFKPGTHENNPAKSPEWNRGAYLVRGLGHCSACHSERNVLGATSVDQELQGGQIPMQNWYAPSLTDAAEAGVAGWEARHVVALLKRGVAPQGTASGPMAEVVYRSTQYLTEADLGAMALYLRDLARPEVPQPVAAAKPPATAARGQVVYETHCQQCHGKSGEGRANAYPPLAGNRAITLANPANLIQITLKGGYPPATAGNPRPFGMPPFATTLNENDIGAVLTYIRTAWGNQAPEVTGLMVVKAR